MSTNVTRRSFLKLAGMATSLAVLGLAGCGATATPTKARATVAPAATKAAAATTVPTAAPAGATPTSAPVPTTAPSVVPTATLVAGPVLTVPVPTVTQMGCFGKIPAGRPPAQSWGEIITGYQLRGQLPQNLVNTAPVFRVRALDGSREWAEGVARRLGLTAEPVAIQSGDPAYPEYQVSEGSRRLQMWSISAAYSYQHEELLSPLRPPERLPADEAEAISIAQAFLERHGLLPSDCRSHPEAELMGGSWADSKGKMIQAPRSWEVRFPRHLEGKAVGGSWMSGVRVTLGEGGGVAAFTYLHREAEAECDYPLRTVAEAWEEVLGGRASHVDTVALGTGGRKPQPFGVIVEGVELGYREAEVINLQGYLQPCYLFQGEAETQGGDVPIAIYVPALAREYLEGGG